MACTSWLQNVHGITEFLRNTKLCKHLRYIYLKIFPFCNCALLPPTVVVLETFLEAILWAPFQLFRRILNDVICIKKRRPFDADFLLGKGKNRLVLGWEHGNCSSVVTLFFAKKSLTKADRCAGALSWRGNQLFIFLFFGAFPSDHIHKMTRGIKVHFFIRSFTFRNELIMENALAVTLFAVLPSGMNS